MPQIPPFSKLCKSPSEFLPFIYCKYLLSAVISMRGCNG
jgi:hypothetical protein